MGHTSWLLNQMLMQAGWWQHPGSMQSIWVVILWQTHSTLKLARIESLDLWKLHYRECIQHRPVKTRLSHHGDHSLGSIFIEGCMFSWIVGSDRSRPTTTKDDDQEGCYNEKNHKSYEDDSECEIEGSRCGVAVIGIVACACASADGAARSKKENTEKTMVKALLCLDFRWYLIHYWMVPSGHIKIKGPGKTIWFIWLKQTREESWRWLDIFCNRIEAAQHLY